MWSSWRCALTVERALQLGIEILDVHSARKHAAAAFGRSLMRGNARNCTRSAGQLRAGPAPLRSRRARDCRDRSRRRPAPARGRDPDDPPACTGRRAARAWQAVESCRCVIGSPAMLSAPHWRMQNCGSKRSTCASMLRPHLGNSRIAGAGRQRHVELGAGGGAAAGLGFDRRCPDTGYARSRACRQKSPPGSSSKA